MKPIVPKYPDPSKGYSQLLRSSLIFASALLALFSIALALSKGSVSVSIYQLLFYDNQEFNRILFHLRIIRTLCAFITGGLLSLAGMLMQLLLQNPLADPYILGVSSGAAIMTLVLMLIGASQIYLLAGAWIGSIASIIFILLLTRKHRWQTQHLSLAGISVACGLSACINFILLISPANHLPSMLFWLSGDLNTTEFPAFSLGVFIVGIVTCLILTPGFNLLVRGEREAEALGLPVKRYKIFLYLLSTLFTATAVTMAGCIGFVGLIIPHIARLLIGYNYFYLIPVSVFLGGSLLTLADTFARSAFAPQQIPVGIIIALIGVPVFVWLLQKS